MDWMVRCASSEFRGLTAMLCGLVLLGGATSCRHSVPPWQVLGLPTQYLAVLAAHLSNVGRIFEDDTGSLHDPQKGGTLAEDDFACVRSNGDHVLETPIVSREMF